MKPAPPTGPDLLAQRLAAEGALTLPEAAKLVPAKGTRSRSTTTLLRWILRGHHGIRLEGAVGADGRRITSRQALARFLAAITAALAGAGPRSRHRPARASQLQRVAPAPDETSTGSPRGDTRT
jgi:hypothetical protein